MARKSVKGSEWAPKIVPGAVFDTPFETGCVVTTGEIDPHGATFLATDSAGEEVTFSLVMIIRMD